MPWNEPGGDNKDPWKSNDNKKSSGGGIDDLMEQISKTFGSIFGGGSSKNDGNSNSPSPTGGIIVFAVIGVLVWLSSGIYTIDERERGIILRFGSYTETVKAGLHWHIPYPIEKLEIVDVGQNRVAENRSQMLTKDENIVDIAVSVQYQINSPEDYLFNVKDVDNLRNQTMGTLHQVMRSAMREVVGQNDMDAILQEGREKIAQDAHSIMQGILDEYKSGLEVLKVNMTYAEAPTEVKAAFDEANKAREDMNRFQNEAETYAKRILPKARGEAARLVEEAEAYKDQTIAHAEGDASRFNQLVVEYNKAPEVTRERLYLDTMENVLSKSSTVLLDAQSGNNLMYLPLDKLTTGGGTSSNNGSSAPTAEEVAAALKAQVANSANSRKSVDPLSSTRQPRSTGTGR